jgi:hypothetical protein
VSKEGGLLALKAYSDLEFFSVPVARAADSSKPGKGTITFHSSGDPLHIQGHDTQFTKQLVKKGQIVLPKSTGHDAAEVVEIISDTELKIKKEYKEQKAVDALNGKGVGEKEKQSGSPGCKYNCLPFVDQTKMYASVYESLAKGGSLGIFPEGEYKLERSKIKSTDIYSSHRRKPRPDRSAATPSRCRHYGIGSHVC